MVRTLTIKVKEHQRAVTILNIDTSALVENVLTEDHRIKWKETTIIRQHPFTQPIVESWYINHLLNTMNRGKESLPEIYHAFKLPRPPHERSHKTCQPVNN